MNIAESFKEKKPGITNLMMLYQPQIHADKIEVVVESEVQKNIFSEQWEAIVRIIKQRIEAESIDIELLLSSNNEQVKKKLFGPQDKMKRLIEINPAIARLSKELGLDFDY